jgi:signal peptidase I
MLRFVKNLIWILATAISIFMAVYVVVNGIAIQTVTSRSMEPTFAAGDTIVSREIDVANVVERDIVILPSPDDPAQRFSHRVFEVVQRKPFLQISTKGDANPIPDKWLMQINSQEVPKVIAVLPTSSIFNNPIGRSSIFYALVALGFCLFILGSWRLIRNRA